MRKHYIFFLLAAALLLLTACGEGTHGELNYPYASDGNYATDGNVYYAESYATEGNAIDYSEQLVLYATDGNVRREELTTVRVSTAEELLNAIAPYTEILLAPGEYNLSRVTPALYNYCYFHPTFPIGDEGGSELVLCNLNDCILASESGNCADVTLIAEPRTAAVLKIEDSYGIQLRGLTLGHTEGAICSGAVLSLMDSGSVYAEGCDLYGCGTVGLDCTGSYGVTLADCTVHDCSYGGAQLYNSQSILLRGVSFRNVGDYTVLTVNSSHWVETENCAFEGKRNSAFLSENWSDHVFFDDCSFADNDFHHLFSIYNSDPPEFRGCDLSAVQCQRPYDSVTPDIRVMVDGKEF